MKEPKEPDIGYTVTNKKNFFFYFQYNWQYLHNIRYFNYFNVYLTHIVTQSQVMLCILVIPVIPF